MVFVSHRLIYIWRRDSISEFTFAIRLPVKQAIGRGTKHLGNHWIHHNSFAYSGESLFARWMSSHQIIALLSAGLPEHDSLCMSPSVREPSVGIRWFMVIKLMEDNPVHLTIHHLTRPFPIPQPSHSRLIKMTWANELNQRLYCFLIEQNLVTWVQWK